MSRKIKDGGWSEKHSACLNCNDTFYQHHGRGYCIACYPRIILGKAQGDYIPRIGWSREYDYCVICKTDCVLHHAKGLCLYCYNHKRYLRKHVPP